MRALFLFCALGFGSRGDLRAAGATWDASLTPNTVVVDGTGQWNLTGTNWLSGGVDGTYVQGSDVAFGVNGGATSNITTNTTVTLGTNITVGNLDIENDSKLGTVTIAASSYILTITGSLTYSPNTTISGTVDFTNGLVDVADVPIGGLLKPMAAIIIPSRSTALRKLSGVLTRRPETAP